MHTFKISLLGTLIFIVLPLKLFAGGSTVGNGGDLVACRNSNLSQVQYKSLDYLLTVAADPDEDLISVSSLEDSISNIQMLLDEKVPELAAGFRNYISLLWNNNSHLSRVWEKAPFGLISIRDEEIGSARSVPDSCKEIKNGESHIKIVQAIIRLKERFSQTAPKIYYAYVPEIIEKVKISDPIQISFLIFHEWLWDFSKNVERNRRINRLFHSASFHKLSSSEIKAQLESLGFILPSTNTALYESDFCQATQSSMDDLKLKGNKFVLGNYVIHRRTRYCDAGEGCGAYQENDNSVDSLLPGAFQGSILPAFQTGNFIKIVNRASTLRKPMSKCEFNSLGETLCDVFNNSDGPYKFNGKPVLFSGHISSECLHLKFSIQTKQSETFWTEDDFVMFSQFEEQ